MGMTTSSNKESNLAIFWRLRNLFSLVLSLLAVESYAVKLLHWLDLAAS